MSYASSVGMRVRRNEVKLRWLDAEIVRKEKVLKALEEKMQAMAVAIKIGERW